MCFIVLQSIEMYFQRKIKSLLVPIATVLFMLYSSTPVETIEGQSLEVVTLYDENDEVVELFDDTIDQIVDSGQIWVVEFYAHWCGHCQRFAPQWKEVAKQFKVWNKWINIAAINCAQQDCKNFSINGTPTVRVFGPRYPGINENNETENIGRDVVARHEVQYWYETILSEVETIQQEELERTQESGNLDNLVEQGLPNMVPYSTGVPLSLSISSESSSEPSSDCSYILRNKFLVSILESTEFHGVGRTSEDEKLSRRAILELSKRFHNIHVNRVLPNDTNDFLESLSLYQEHGVLSRSLPYELSDSPLLPGFLIYAISDDCTASYHYHPLLVYNLTLPEEVTYDIIYGLINEYQLNILNNMTQWIKDDTNMIPNDLTTELPDTTTDSDIRVNDISDLVHDAVSQDDIERAIRKSLVDEIGRHSTMNEAKVRALYNWITALMKYLPLRKEIFSFVKELRQKLNEKIRAQNFTELDGSEYSEIVDALQERYEPFNTTSTSWVGCLGSDPKFRGYPCSLWQTFHSLTVGALLADEMELGDGVAKAIADYVHHFFTCRHCADHFGEEIQKNKVESQHNNTFPVWPSDAVFWMWKLHNMANIRLKGDLTEDPDHPKLFWPSDQNCPRCYNWKSKRSISVDVGLAVLIEGSMSNGTMITHVVNKLEVVKYLAKVYGTNKGDIHNIPAAEKDNSDGVIERLREIMETEGNTNTTSPRQEDDIRIKDEMKKYCARIPKQADYGYQYKLF